MTCVCLMCIQENPEEMFRQTVADMVREGAKDPDSIETIGLEVSCFKHAEHRSFADVVHAVVPALMEFVTPSTSVVRPPPLLLAPRQAPPLTACVCALLPQMALANSIIDTIKTWAPLIAKFVQGSQVSVASVVWQHMLPSLACLNNTPCMLPQDEMALVAAMQEFFIGAEFEVSAMWLVADSCVVYITKCTARYPQQRANGFGFALRQCNAMELISDETVQGQ